MLHEGGVEDIAKHIKKKRIQDRKKNGKKGAKLRPGSASQVTPFVTNRGSKDMVQIVCPIHSWCNTCDEIATGHLG